MKPETTRLTHADKERIDALLHGLTDHVWYFLDNEPDLTGDDIGECSQAVEEAVRAVLTRVWSVDSTPTTEAPHAQD